MWPPENCVVSRHPEVRWAELEGGIALLDIRTSQLVRLNRTAAAIWSLLEKPRLLEDICNQMAAMFVDANGNLCTEVSGFVRSLLDEKLVVVGGHPHEG